MFAKILTATIAVILTLLIFRKMAALAERARAKVRAERQRSTRAIATLRQDPETGVWRPED